MDRWTEEQLTASIDGYLDMRERIANGERVNKAQAYRELANTYGKDKAAWARRFGNISQVMDELGYRLIPGLKPLQNVGANVTRRLAEMIQNRIGDIEASTADQRVRAELAHVAQSAEIGKAFAPADAEDQRTRVLRSVVQRRGQPSFRKALIEVYSGKCAISGCSIVDILEAAHVFPYRDGTSSDLSNGLLLRADIHTLFDLRLISVDPDSLRVVACPALLASEYSLFANRELAVRGAGAVQVSPESLRWHRASCNW